MTKNTTNYEQACKLRDLGVKQGTFLAHHEGDNISEVDRIDWEFSYEFVQMGVAIVAAHTETELREVIVGMGYTVMCWEFADNDGQIGAWADQPSGDRFVCADNAQRPMIDTLVDLLVQILEGRE